MAGPPTAGHGTPSHEGSETGRSNAAMITGKKHAVAGLLRDPRFELLPLKGVEDRAEALPRGATVTITSSPAKGQDRTIELAEDLRARGFHVVPHIAAKQIRSDVHLKEIVDRLDTAGVSDVFVVGGDASDEPGGFSTGAEVLEALAWLDHPFSRVGVPAYPEGHYLVDDATLNEALLAKQAHATYMVTQLCFDSRTICRWLAEARAGGVALPCYVGIPGAVDTHQLLRVSMRIGIGDSVRFLRGNRSTALRLLRARGYRPDALVRGLAEGLREGRCDIEGLHLYTFNQVERSARWAAQARARAEPAARRPGRRVIRPGTARHRTPEHSTRR